MVISGYFPSLSNCLLRLSDSIFFLLIEDQETRHQYEIFHERKLAPTG